ncbi:hypothetical protein ACWEOZ_10810 [Actinoplanes sp. NPDC004185]
MAIEVDRTVNSVGAVGLAGRQNPVGYHDELLTEVTRPPARNVARFKARKLTIAQTTTLNSRFTIEMPREKTTT